MKPTVDDYLQQGCMRCKYGASARSKAAIAEGIGMNDKYRMRSKEK